MIKKRNLDPSLVQWIQTQTGLGPLVGDVKFMVPAASSSSQQRTLLQEQGVSDGDMFLTLTAAEAALTSYKNEILVVAPGWYEEIATTTWDLYDTHVLGASPTPMQPRADLVHTTNAFTPMTTISGRGNSFRNLTFRHGTAEADYVGCLISGRYNYFENVYWMTPMVAAQGDHASYRGVDITGHNNYFRGCRFGSDGTARGTKNYTMQIRGIGNIFEDCIFVAFLDAATPHHLGFCIDTGHECRVTVFKNCTFISYSSNFGFDMAEAVDVGTFAGAVYFDPTCQFVGITNIASTVHSQRLYYSVVGSDADLADAWIALRQQG